MPLYQFKCVNCSNEFEDQVKVDERENVKCPACDNKTEVVIVNPQHYRHLSWSTWQVGVGK